MPSHYADLKAIPQAEMLQSQVVAHIVQTLHGLLPRFCGRIGIAPSAVSSACSAAKPIWTTCTACCKTPACPITP